MYNREEIYKKHIKEKVEEINDLCKSFGIVHFMSFCLQDDDKDTKYENFICGSSSNGVSLKKDYIRGYINVSNGFDTVPPSASINENDYWGDNY